MKKKITALFLCVALAAIAIVGASLAYFTDTDNETNTFAVGNVKIDLIEQERGENGLQPFTQGKKLSPIVGSAQGEKDELGMPTAKNYVDKMVTVRNTGSEKAYIRAYFAIPAALDDGYETFNAGMNVLHFNFGNKVVDGNITSTEGVEWIWTHGNKWNYFETTPVFPGRRKAGTTSRPPWTASSTMSTSPTTIRPLPPVPPPSSSFRACISTSPSISARMASATPLARKSLWTRAGIGAASPAPCSP